MSSSRNGLSTALRRATALFHAHSRVHPRLRRTSMLYAEPTALRPFASLNPKPDDRGAEHSTADSRVHSRKNDQGRKDKVVMEDGSEEKPGAMGGFMRGLMGGQAVAVEDAFIAEAKEQGLELPPPRPPLPPKRNAALVPVKRRKRKEEEPESESIRDRIFGRFAGSAFMQGAFNAKERIAERIDESDNPIVNMFRNLYDRFFAENEMAMVLREIREEDAPFMVSEFLRQVETEFVPSILGSYLRADREALKSGCTDEAFAMLNASIRERNAEGIVMDTSILHIGDVELAAGKVLEDAPVLIVTFMTQQINCLRDRSGTVVEGQEDDIRAVYYAWAFVKEAEYEDFSPSGGGMGGNAERRENVNVQDNEQGKNRNKDNETAAGTKKCAEETEHNRPWKLMEMVIRGAHSTI